jgi:hypothetical protein
MNDEIERIWKEAVLCYSRNYPGIFLEGLRETTDSLRIASVLDEIRIEHLLNISLDCYR